MPYAPILPIVWLHLKKKKLGVFLRMRNLHRRDAALLEEEIHGFFSFLTCHPGHISLGIQY